MKKENRSPPSHFERLPLLPWAVVLLVHRRDFRGLLVPWWRLEDIPLHLVDGALRRAAHTEELLVFLGLRDGLDADILLAPELKSIRRSRARCRPRVPTVVSRRR